jgi:hypothetical protein
MWPAGHYSLTPGIMDGTCSVGEVQRQIAERTKPTLNRTIVIHPASRWQFQCHYVLDGCLMYPTSYALSPYKQKPNPEAGRPLTTSSDTTCRTSSDGHETVRLEGEVCHVWTSFGVRTDRRINYAVSKCTLA